MDLTKETIEKIQTLAAPNISEHHGYKFTDKTLTPILPVDYRPATLLVHTLTGIVDFLREIKIEDNYFIHVESPSEVHLYSKARGVKMERTHYIESNLQDFRGFAFGQFLPHEQFIINLQTLFIPNDDLARLLKLVGTAKNQGSIESTDDGIGQKMQIAKGVHLGETVPIANPFQLAPYRTFPEVEQPESMFVLRVRGKEGSIPECALFESDGLAWKIKAIQIIRLYLKKEFPEIPIIA